MVIVLHHTLFATYLYFRDRSRFLNGGKCDGQSGTATGGTNKRSCQVSEPDRRFNHDPGLEGANTQGATLALCGAADLEQLRCAVKEAIKLVLPHSGGVVLYVEEPDNEDLVSSEGGRHTLPHHGPPWQAHTSRKQVVRHTDDIVDPHIRKLLNITGSSPSTVLSRPVLDPFSKRVLAVILIVCDKLSEEEESNLHFLETQISSCHRRMRQSCVPSSNSSKSRTDSILQLCAELYEQDASSLQIKVIRYLQQQTQAQSGFVLLVVPDAKELYCQVVGDRVLPEEIRFPVETSSFALVMESKQPITLEQLSKDGKEEIEKWLGCSMSSLLCVPVASRSTGELIALICVVNKLNSSRFTDDDAQIIQHCFKYTSTVLTSTLAVQHERRLKNDTQTLLQVARNLFTHLGELLSLSLRTVPSKLHHHQICECRSSSVWPLSPPVFRFTSQSSQAKLNHNPRRRKIGDDFVVGEENCPKKLRTDSSREKMQWELERQDQLANVLTNTQTDMLNLSVPDSGYRVQAKVKSPLKKTGKERIPSKTPYSPRERKTSGNTVTTTRSSESEASPDALAIATIKTDGLQDFGADGFQPLAASREEPNTGSPWTLALPDMAGHCSSKAFYPKDPTNSAASSSPTSFTSATSQEGTTGSYKSIYSEDLHSPTEQPFLSIWPEVAVGSRTSRSDTTILQLESASRDASVYLEAHEPADDGCVLEEDPYDVALGPRFSQSEPDLHVHDDSVEDPCEDLPQCANMSVDTPQGETDLNAAFISSSPPRCRSLHLCISGSYAALNEIGDDHTCSDDPDALNKPVSCTIVVEDTDQGARHTISTESLVPVTPGNPGLTEDVMTGQHGLTYSETATVNLPYDLVSLQPAGKCHLKGAWSNDLTTLLREIMQEARNLTKAERCSVFLIDNEEEELVAKVFDGVTKDDNEVQKEIRIPINQGIAGHVATKGELLNIRDAYSHPLFYRGIDESTGFRTRNILCFPIKDENGTVIGVAQLCNKKTGPSFTSFDEEIASAFSVYCCISIIHSLMYKKLQEAHNRNNLSIELMIYHMKVSPEDVDILCQEEIKTPSQLNPDFALFSYSPRTLPENDTITGVLSMFEDLGFISRWRIKKDTLSRFLLMVRRGYRDPPYHNWMHAYAVAHFCYLLSKNLDLPEHLNDIEVFALFVSCLCHDIDHRGTNNSFQMESSSVLAALYSSEGSVMERHHFAQTMCILNTDGCNIFENLSTKDYQQVLDLVRDIILATDLAHHLRILNSLDTMATVGYDKGNKKHHKLLLCILMTACDLSDQTKNWKNTKKIAALIYQEFFSQGDMEKNLLGKNPIEMMDRERARIPDLQISFLNHIALPVYKVIARLFPKSQCVLDTVEENKARWEKISEFVKQKQDMPLTAEQMLEIDVDDGESNSKRNSATNMNGVKT